MAIPRILHYPGSKWSMADGIINTFRKHQTYLEPFFGSGAVLFSKQGSPLETVNDLDGEVVNLFRINRERPEELARAIKLPPHSREEYYLSYENIADDLERCKCIHKRKIKRGNDIHACKLGKELSIVFCNRQNVIKVES